MVPGGRTVRVSASDAALAVATGVVLLDLTRHGLEHPLDVLWPVYGIAVRVQDALTHGVDAPQDLGDAPALGLDGRLNQVSDLIVGHRVTGG
jgi:hypothetical protein